MRILADLFSIFSGSGKEFQVVNYISKYLTKNGLRPHIDPMGNIFVKNKVPGKNRILLSAHTDTVGTEAPKVKLYKSVEDTHIFVSTNNAVLGGDDKCGCRIIMDMITDDNITIPLSAILSTQEEAGCKGIVYALTKRPQFFKDVIFGICLDRMDDDDLILENVGTDLCSFEIGNNLRRIAFDYQYSDGYGSISDISSIVETLHINGMNMSVGYHNPHSSNEWVVWEEVMKAKNMATRIATEIYTLLTEKSELIKFNDYAQWNQTRTTSGCVWDDSWEYNRFEFEAAKTEAEESNYMAHYWNTFCNALSVARPDFLKYSDWSINSSNHQRPMYLEADAVSQEEIDLISHFFEIEYLSFDEMPLGAIRISHRAFWNGIKFFYKVYANQYLSEIAHKHNQKLLKETKKFTYTRINKLTPHAIVYQSLSKELLDIIYKQFGEKVCNGKTVVSITLSDFDAYINNYFKQKLNSVSDIQESINNTNEETKDLKKTLKQLSEDMAAEAFGKQSIKQNIKFLAKEELSSDKPQKTIINTINSIIDVEKARDARAPIPKPPNKDV